MTITLPGSTSPQGSIQNMGHIRSFAYITTTFIEMAIRYLITQHVESEIYGVALATHETYFRRDKMAWLKANIGAIDWTEWPALKRQVEAYDEDDDTNLEN